MKRWPSHGKLRPTLASDQWTDRRSSERGNPSCSWSGLNSKNDRPRQHRQRCRTHRRGAESMTEAEFSQLLQDLVLQAESGNLSRPAIIATLQEILDALKNAASN